MLSGSGSYIRCVLQGVSSSLVWMYVRDWRRCVALWWRVCPFPGDRMQVQPCRMGGLPQLNYPHQNPFKASPCGDSCSCLADPGASTVVDTLAFSPQAGCMHETVLNRSPLMLPLASSGWDSMYSLVGLYLFAESRGLVRCLLGGPQDCHRAVAGRIRHTSLASA